MINQTKAINITFNGSTESQPIYIYIPFRVTTITLLDSKYGVEDSNPTFLYNLRSNLFDGNSLPLNNQDTFNWADLPYLRNSRQSIEFTTPIDVNGLYSFTIDKIGNIPLGVGIITDYHLLLQFTCEENVIY